jgi:hypothetical protein
VGIGIQVQIHGTGQSRLISQEQKQDYRNQDASICHIDLGVIRLFNKAVSTAHVCNKIR